MVVPPEVGWKLPVVPGAGLVVPVGRLTSKLGVGRLGVGVAGVLLIGVVGATLCGVTQ
jgi:hypothetical protein